MTPMTDPILYGPSFSTYTRSAHLTLEEKGVAYRLEEVDIFGDPKAKVAQLTRHPFGKIPAFEHDGFALYETGAIMRYVDEAFPGPALQPSAARERARMAQILGITDSYLYPSAVLQIIIPRFRARRTGVTADEAAIESAVPAARRSIGAIETLLGTNAYLAGDSLSLADLHLVPIIFYFALLPEGQRILPRAPNLQRWWAEISARPSVKKTAPALPATT